METISQKEIDRKLESMWKDLGDIPFDEDENGELILAVDWECFKAGTGREEIWYWFDERHSKGVAYLMFNK